MCFETVSLRTVQRTSIGMLFSTHVGKALLLIGLTLGFCSIVSAEISRDQMLSHPEQIQAWIGKKQISYEQIPNPHWNDEGCTACHSKQPAANKLFLRGKSTDELCEFCHSGAFDHSYIHPNGIELTTDMQQRIAKDFAGHLGVGKRLECTTCHEVVKQCLRERRSEKRINSAFLRGAPYQTRSGLCYQCHDINGYQRLNAHDQRDKDGKLQEHTCLICHDKLKGLEEAKSIKEVGFNVKGSLVGMCGSCHELKPHPSTNFSFTKKGTPDHLVVPPEKIRKKMLQSEKERGVILPLDPQTGRVFCGTCHNPHEKGVIKYQAAAKGADENKRLRTPNICTNCHDK